jgi:alpha-glucosidase (family GH31 glycosyl hydrolase)
MMRGISRRIALLSAVVAGAAAVGVGQEVLLPLTLKLESENLQRPLVFLDRSPRAGGAFWYRTAAGTVHLDSGPAEIAQVAGGFEGTWRTSDGRTASVTVTPVGEDFVLELSADPDDDVLGWGLAVQASTDEFFTGALERTVDGDQRESWREGITQAMNLYGQRIEMLIRPTLSLYAPFFLSSAGYGIFFDTTWPGVYDFCHTTEDQVTLYHEGPSLRAEIYIGDPASVVQKHSLRAGPPVLPPKWVFRPWRWRDEHRHLTTYYDGTPVTAPFNSEVVEDVLMMEALEIPLGVYWIDRPWATGPMGYDDFRWDPERVPNAERMIGWLNTRDIEFALWIAPWVMGDMADVAVREGYNLAGQKKRVQDVDPRVLLDFTNPDAVKWWQEEGLRPILESGVKGFKMDRAEELVPDSREFKTFDDRTTREIHNEYPVQYLRTAWEIAHQVHGDDIAMMPRAAFTGSSRYGVFWGGDIGSPAEGLRAAIIAGLRSAVIGYPIWGSDTGGYWQAELDREVTARWLAFSAFCPIMEVGPTENRGFWNMAREPHYDAELIAIWRLYSIIHDRLADYSLRHAVEAHETGMPIMRPLFLHYPDQKEAWEDWQTYLYGPDILVSAIWQKGTTEHTLYLPAGERWIDAWTGQTHDGGRSVTVTAPLYKIPFFVREGSDIHYGTLLEKVWVESLKIARDPPDLAALQQSLDRLP